MNKNINRIEFKEIWSFKNLHKSYLKARKCKKYRKDILFFSYNLEKNLINLQKDLLNQKYIHGSYREFIIQDSKKREIKVAPFRDRVVHHVLHNTIEPVFEKSFIVDSYACRKNKGTHKAIRKLESFLKLLNHKKTSKEIYCLKCDVLKYFDNINHNILLNFIKKKVKDEMVLQLIKDIVYSTNKEPGKGIPIGNLTSQLFANIYLNELDQFIKHKLKVKYYIRYMDDFLIIDCDKNKLQKNKKYIKNFLFKKLKLKLHPNKDNIFSTKKGINFLGYIVYFNYKLLKKDTVKRFIKKTKTNQKLINKGFLKEDKFRIFLQSWFNYAKFGNSWNLCRKLEEEMKFKFQ